MTSHGVDQAFISNIEAELARRVVGYTAGEPDALQSGLQDITTRWPLREILRELLASPALTERSLTRSSIHNNGFLKIILASTPSYQLRLHVWDCRPGETLSAVTESVHSHTADFASIILLGSYRHEVFRPAEVGTSYLEYDYHATRGAREFSLESVGARHLQKASDALLPAGTLYSLAGDILHRVVPEPGIVTSSLVVQGPTCYDTIKVLSDTTLRTGETVPVKPLPADSFSRYTQLLLNERLSIE